MALPLTYYMFRPVAPARITEPPEDDPPVIGPPQTTRPSTPWPTTAVAPIPPYYIPTPAPAPAPAPAPRRSLGILNYGVTCFANAALQCLLAPFMDGTPFGGLLMGSIGSPVAAEFRLLQHSSDLIRPMPLLLRMPVRFRGARQEDSQDFLSELLWIIHNDMRKDKALPRPSVDLPYDEYAARLIESDTSPVLETFTFISHVVLTCKRCGKTTQSTRHSNFLGLAFPPASFDAPSVSELVAAHGQRTNCADGVDCRGCRRREPCTKQEILRAPPRILIVHLHRFRPEGKLTNPVVLDDLVVFDRKYELVGVIDHLGSSERSGHYTARVRAAAGNWLVADDTYVGPTDRPTNPRCNPQPSPYVLFYKTVV